MLAHVLSALCSLFFLYIINTAALVGCRTDEELNDVLVPELAHKFTACSDNIFVSEVTRVHLAQKSLCSL